MEAGREWPTSTCHSMVPLACPKELSQKTLSGLTLCMHVAGMILHAGCESTVFSTLGLNYSQVCGQVMRLYQRGTPDCFYP